MRPFSGDMKTNQKKMQHQITEGHEVLSKLRKMEEEQSRMRSMEAEIQRDIIVLLDIPNQNEYLWKKKDYESLLPQSSNTNNFEINQLQEMVNKIIMLLHENKTKLDMISKECKNKEKDTSVKKALLDKLKEEKATIISQIHNLLHNNKRGIKKIERVIKSMRKMETDMYGGADAPASIDPQELLNYIDTQLREINEGEVSADNVVSVIKRLQKMAKVKDDNGTILRNVCPCYDREMNDCEVSVFKKTIKALVNINTSELVTQNQESFAQPNTEKAQYERWRGSVYNSMDDWKLCDRLKAELNEKEEMIINDKTDIENLTEVINILKMKLEEYEYKNYELQILAQESYRMCNHAQRINTKQNKLRKRKRHEESNNFENTM